MTKQISILIFLYTINSAIVSATVVDEVSLLTTELQETPITEDVTNTINDEAILKAIEELGDQFELIELDKQHNQKNKLNAEHQKAIQENKFNEEMDAFIDDGFDELDINEELDGELNETIDDFLLEEIAPITTHNTKTKNLKNSIESKSNDIKGVGVTGVEEYIINQLDKSELIDIEPELETLLNKKSNLLEKIDDY